ncbi:MAG TPA: LLM class flavin-dependent oxidoreductase [Amnibacterium sp.]|jgi:alkanesulfonate monooxygenase SsuD/methylene tetrahydromethanopterin reductase-like flavin-dependent oxidoreductase (luciferase family)|nr:LLM class flavin-dependent oxidoreductase [Amnibacterium sp.]
MTVSSFRFGVVEGRPASGAAWLERAREVESAGYDLLLLPDTRFTPSPFPALAAAAAVTTRLAVAPWVLAAPLRSPAAVVREVAALQMLSAGRFELGIGTGRPDAADEAAVLGATWGTGAERRRILAATVAAVRAEVSPPPPVTIAASGPLGLEAAAIADTVALALPPTAVLDDVLRAIDVVRAQGADPGFALQLSGVGGRLVPHLERQGLTAEDLREAVGVLRGDVDAMAEALQRLRERTGIATFPVSGMQAEAFAPVVAALR